MRATILQFLFDFCLSATAKKIPLDRPVGRTLPRDQQTTLVPYIYNLIHRDSARHSTEAYPTFLIANNLKTMHDN